MMKENKLRRILREKRTSVSTRLWSTWPIYTEVLGVGGNFDYMEFVAEYAPFSQTDLENLAWAAELYDMGSMIKVDDSARRWRRWWPMVAGTSGLYGCPTRQFISSPAGVTQQEHIQRLNGIVLCFMIEKQEAVENVEEICSVPGVDMVQFGPSDYCMSRGWNRSDHAEDYKAAERRVIEAALRHGVQPRCEINAPEEAQYYIGLGVRHFSLGIRWRC